MRESVSTFDDQAKSDRSHHRELFNSSLNHHTIFVPSCFKPDPKGKFTQQTNFLIGLLRENGSKKTCSKPESISKFLKTKVDMFLNDELSHYNFMGCQKECNNSMEFDGNTEPSPRKKPKLLKVIVMTIVISENLKKDEAKFNRIKKAIIETVHHVHKIQKGVVLGLNLVNGGKRISCLPED